MASGPSPPTQPSGFPVRDLSELFWMNLQSSYDLEVEKGRLGDRLETEVKEFPKSK